jgi:hypothetical protein
VQRFISNRLEAALASLAVRQIDDATRTQLKTHLIKTISFELAPAKAR